MKTFIVILVIYLFSCLGAYKMIQKSHYHPEGRWNLLEPEITDIGYVIFPVINTYVAVEYLCGNWRYKGFSLKERKTTKFFKPKKAN